uniref:Uncharacterized protein n=1 Tax=Rhabditophanes sp. KR3021 TaxID=114890 RepID=A0AC35TIJ3_9BILA
MKFNLFAALILIYLMINIEGRKPKIQLSTKTRRFQRNSIQFQPYKNDFCVYYNFWSTSLKLNEKTDPRITLVLHSTISYMNHLEEQIKNWEGPISISIFMPTPMRNRCGRRMLFGRKECSIYGAQGQEYFRIFEWFKKMNDIRKVSLHLYFQRAMFKTCPKLYIPDTGLEKGVSVEAAYETTLQHTKHHKVFFRVYPINVGRNIARIGMKTELFLSSDIENYASENYESKVRVFAKKHLLKHQEKIVLIHRRFETVQGHKFPTTKRELFAMFNNHKAFVFHNFFFPRGHFIGDLEVWFNVKESRSKASLFNIYTYTNPMWEPQFVGDSRVPFHDENFPYRARSNTHVSNLLCFEGFGFFVMNDVFTVHEGVKKRLLNNEKIALDFSKEAFRGYVDEFNRNNIRKHPNMRNVCQPLPY